MALPRSYLWCLLVVCFCIAAFQCASAWPTVRKGNRGPNVVVVQDLLPKFGGPSNGNFDAKTEAAVKALQKLKRVPATGIVDGKTWPKMANTIRSGKGKAAHAIQYLLVHRFKLLSARDITSVYGQTTRNAVKKFQGRYRLRQTGDVDQRTWEALLSGTPSKPTTTPSQPTNGVGPCRSVKRSRAGIVALARSMVGKKVIYTQKSPAYEFYGIRQKTCPGAAPKYSSAFGFIAWMYWTAYGNGPDFVRNCRWGTCSAQVMTNKTGRKVTLKQARPGDVVVWWGTHGWPLMHAALYVGDNTVVTMGYYFQDRMFQRTVLYRNINWWKKNGFYPYGYTIRTYDQVV